jgi:hypothetical protein
MLNRIAAIQAAAEILDDNQEFCHGDRHAFLTVIQTETARLHTLVRHIIFVPRLPAARIRHFCVRTAQRIEYPSIVRKLRGLITIAGRL